MTLIYDVYMRATSYRLKIKGNKYFMEIKKTKHTGVAILKPDKLEFKTKTINKWQWCTLHNESTQQENVTLVNIYASNIGTPKYIKKILV